MQVADRWHLLKNLGDALEKFLVRNQKVVKATAADRRSPGYVPENDGTPASPPSSASPAHCSDHTGCRKTGRKETDRAARRQRRVDRYAEVVTLYRGGMNLSRIARQMGLCRKTVRAYLAGDGFPERRERAPRAGKLTPFEASIRRRFAEGCHSATRLFHAIREEGYTGGYTAVSTYVATVRDSYPDMDLNSGRNSELVCGSASRGGKPVGKALLSLRRLSWLLTNLDSPKVAEPDRHAAEQLIAASPEVAAAAALGTQFCTMVRERRATELPDWLDTVWQSGIPELKTFAAGLVADRAAVEAALSLEWSNGQTEGQVNRLKFVKRQMYGCASFDLLKARVVPQPT